MRDRPLVSVVVPAMNEEENIPLFYETARKITDQLGQFDWEFVFVDDGSTDRTAERTRELCARDPQVRLVQLSRNFGSYAAIQAGFQFASGDAIICISADLQDPPDLFAPFTKNWTAGNQVVWGVRAHRDDSLAKRTLARLFYLVIRTLGVRGLPLGGMDCGLFDRSVIDAYLPIAEQNNNVFLTIFQLGFSQVQVPYHRRLRTLGHTKWNLAKMIKAALDVVTSVSYVPIRMCSLFGVVFAAFSLIGICVIAVDKIFFGIGVSGWPSVMVAVLLVGGVQLLMLGIMGEYLWRISTEVRRRHTYIVMSTAGFPEKTPRP
jgi:polyisoprenyl-phosphate glycosyltransferase